MTSTNHSISMEINGETVSRDVEPRLLLVHFLRDVLGLTGTHVGCDTSQCGACTVIQNGKAVKSCTRLAVQSAGTRITTIEGLDESGQLHPIQSAFKNFHALQCGFCTPGMVIAVWQLLQRYPMPTLDQTKHGLEGNICRCTGYVNIFKAVESLGMSNTRGSEKF